MNAFVFLSTINYKHTIDQNYLILKNRQWNI